MRGQWTYSGNPTTSPRDELRFLIGDTKPDKPMLSDGECDYLLFQSADVPLVAAIRATEQLIIDCRAMVDQTVGSVSVSWSQRTTNLTGILGMLRRRLVTQGLASPRAGGISVAAKIQNACDEDMVQPQLTARQDHESVSACPDNVTTGPSQLTGRFNP